MQLIYEGIDITDSVEIQTADVYDNAGGIADSIEIKFADSQSLWSKWKPKKGERIVLKVEGFTSGNMFIDQWEQRRGYFLLKALSIPQEAKTENTKNWENVRLTELAGEIAGRYGFKLKTYNIQDWLYAKVGQCEQTDFEFLAYRCMLEGYAVKITDGNVVIYDEVYQELQPAVRTIYPYDIDGDYCFKAKSTGLYRSCLIRHNSISQLIQSCFTPPAAPAGPVLKRNIYINSQAEADRYSRGLLRSVNKYEQVGIFRIELDHNIAAGSCINISDFGMSDGKYIIDQVIYSLVAEKTYLRIRKPLEGY